MRACLQCTGIGSYASDPQSIYGGKPVEPCPAEHVVVRTPHGTVGDPERRVFYADPSSVRWWSPTRHRLFWPGEVIVMDPIIGGAVCRSVCKTWAGGYPVRGSVKPTELCECKLVPAEEPVTYEVVPSSW